ncbi:GAF domain-containing SpoIIE family protein phosphatase [Synechococcus elongatus]|uniref:GAF domain-containing SpoIIE family protein phosphatase n=1 Tax=Synechococcus elongatus PCC 11802 TaxID=2283154 RepID=A0AAT9JUN0_SYNEL
MTTLPYFQPAASPVSAGESSAGLSPVTALKDLVARLDREQRKAQELLASLGFALRSFTNLGQFLELIPLIASRVTDTEGSLLLTLRPDGRFWQAQLHCTDPQLKTALQRITAGLPTETAPVSSPTEAIAAIDRQVQRCLGRNAQLFATAVLVRNQARGRLYVFSLDSCYTWNESRQKLVRLVADQTAVAIENDALTTELRQKERLDRELEIGAEIQLQLLPSQCPAIEGLEIAAACRTASRVGGDYYDFIPTRTHSDEQGRLQPDAGSPWAIAIGDIMGKGVPAGLIMTMLRGMLRAEVLNRHRPSQVLAHLNQVIYADLEHSNRFATLFYSEYDPSTRSLSFSNAAHNPPLLWRQATGNLHRLDAFGMMIGLEADNAYAEQQVQLQPGDVVLYYTDGLTDASDPRGNRFDEENVAIAFRDACRRRLSADALLADLFNRVQRFIGPDRHNEDDMTLVVLRAV